MQLVEKHIINPNSEFYSECDSLCFKSKNLYNLALYIIKQEYINNKNNVVNNIYHLVKNSDDYKALTAKCSCTTLNSLQDNFKSFFKSLDSYNKNPSKFKGRPRLPKYLDKIDGRYMVGYTNQAISKKVFNKIHKIKLSKTNIEFYTKIQEFKDIDCVRIVPRIGYFVIEVIYTVPDVPLKEDNNRYASIDLGLSNLATVVSNVNEFKPFIINGKPLKSINQYYNKKKAKLSSTLAKVNKKNKSKSLNKLTLKRENKINDYFHKSSKLIVDKLKENNISKLVIGKNTNWKDEISLGKKNNQNFVGIPHSRFIAMLSYKCELSGIEVILQEESYTSKASFLDLDVIPKLVKGIKTIIEHEFNGKRISRGLYKSETKNKVINADVNGSYNILRKAIPTAMSNGIEGLGVTPLVINLNGFTINK